MNNSPLLLIIDDEITILKTLKEALEDEKFRVETLSDGNKSLDLIGKLIPDLILLDIFMPNCNGLELLKKIKKEYPQQKIIIISGFGNIPMAIEATKNGALDFIEKPLNLDDILSKILFLKKENHQKPTNKTETKNLEIYGIVGQSYLFLELIQQAEQVANLSLPLLIYGQHGTGKTLLSKYIHQKSPLSKNDFFIIDCSFIKENSFIKKLNEIFSSKKGTLFIKNIDTLDQAAQSALLYCLKKNDNQNIRIIASSCHCLYKLSKNEKFNTSLFHKLNVSPIELPSLNKRRYDIPLLIDYYLKKFNEKYNKKFILNNTSIRTLRNHDWQTNISELKTIIQKITTLTSCNNQVITPANLEPYIGEKKTQIIEEQSFLRFNSLKEATSEFEKNFLIYLLKKNNYDIKQVSERLSLTTLQLRDKILQLNIEINT